jgi:hypothetical protein
MKFNLVGRLKLIVWENKIPESADIGQIQRENDQIYSARILLKYTGYKKSSAHWTLLFYYEESLLVYFYFKPLGHGVSLANRVTVPVSLDELTQVNLNS